MSKFKYTIRADGRLVKKVTINKEPVYLYSYDAKDLEAQYIKLKNDINEGEKNKNNPYTMSQYSDIWYDNYVDPTKLDNATKKMYSDCIRLYIKPEIGHIKMKYLTDLDITKMINTMTAKGITRRREVTLQVVRQIINKAIANKLLTYNVASTVKLTKHVPDEKEPLSNEVMNLVLELPNELDSSVFMMKFILTTGLRPEEVSPLLYTDILNSKEISINKVVDLDSKDLHIDNFTKNKDKRKVPLMDFIYLELERRKETSNTELIFPNIYQKLKSRSSFRRDLERFLKVLNTYYESKQKDLNKDFVLDDSNKISFTLYQLRHTYACILHKAEVPLKEAQTFTGHKDLKVLLQIYTHLDNQDIEKSKNKLNTFFNNIV